MAIEKARHRIEKLLAYDEAVLKDPQSGRIYQRRQTVLYDLRIRGRVNILRFAERVGFTIKRKQRKLKELLQRYRGQPALAYRMEGITE